MTRRGKIALVMLFFCICGTAAMVSQFLHLLRSEPTPSELYSVVYRQMQALQHEDFHSAYDQVALTVRRKLSLEEFSNRVRDEYGPLVHAERLEFGRVEVRGHRAYIEVFFIEQRGLVQPCVFQLGNDNAGWKIEGARLMPRWPRGRVLAGVQT